MSDANRTRPMARLGHLACATGAAGALLLACSGDSTGPGGGPAAATRRLEALVAAEQQGAPGAAAALAPRVRVVDALGQPVAGAVVRFAVKAGGGAVASGVDTTDAQGATRSVPWTLGASVGLNAVEARLDAPAGSVDTASVAFLAMATAQPSTAQPVSVGTLGGTVRPTLPGSGIDSVTIAVPAGAFASPVTFTVATLPVPAPTSVAGASVLARLSVDAGDAQTDSVVRIRIPVRTSGDEVVVAYWYDSVAQKLDPVMVLEDDASSLTIGMSRFSWGGDAAMAAAPRATLGAPASFLGLPNRVRQLVLLLANERTILGGPVSTGFAPGTDDWDFENRGSYLTPNGNCHGQTLAELWYYDMRRSEGAPALSTLHFAGDRVTALTGRENADAYRLATLVQLDANRSSDSQDAIRTALKTLLDRVSMLRLADALRRTGQPQLVAIATARGEGHAIVAYGIDVTATTVTVRVSDPNAPGSAKTITYSRTSNAFVPYGSSLVKGEDESAFPTIRFIPRSQIFSWGSVGARWAQFDANRKSVGNAEFPAYTIVGSTPDYEYRVDARDTLPSTWVDTLVLAGESTGPEIKVGAFRRQAGATSAAGTGWVEGTADALRTRMPLVNGENKLTVYLAATPAQGGARKFVDTRFVTIWRRPLALARTSGQVLPPADTVRFDSDVARTFAIRFETGLPVHELDSRLITVTNQQGDGGVSIARAPYTVDGVRTDSLRITLSTPDTSVKRLRFDLAYRGKVFRTVIAQVVRPSIVLTPPTQVVTGTRTARVLGDGFIEYKLVCAMPWAGEVRGSNPRIVDGEEYRMQPSAGDVLVEQVEWPANEHVSVAAGRYTGTGSWDWRAYARAEEAPRYVTFDVEWRLRFRDPATGDRFVTNTIRMSCR